MSTWRDILPIHPAADALPLLSKEALQELADDIQTNGLHVPITIWYDVVADKHYLLDGRNRLDAMELAGCRFTKLNARASTLTFDSDHPEDGTTYVVAIERDDPAAYVISANLRRRHLPPGELVRYALAIRAASKPETLSSESLSVGGRGHKGEASEVAEQTGVPIGTVRRVIAEQRPKPLGIEYGKAEQKRIARLDAQREAVRQRLLTYCGKQIDFGADARLNVLNWLTTAAMANDFMGRRLKLAEDFMAGKEAGPQGLVLVAPPADLDAGIEMLSDQDQRLDRIDKAIEPLLERQRARDAKDVTPTTSRPGR